MLFALVTYLVFTIRNILTPDLTTEILQTRRAIATASGGFLFWLIIRRVDFSFDTLRGGALTLAGWCGLAGLALLILRVSIGLIEGSALPFELDVRWTISWVGYLGFALALFLAYRVGAAARAESIAPSRSVGPDAVDWLADAIVEEFAQDGPADRRELAARLRQRAGYREADPMDPQINRRVALAERLATRLLS